MDPKTVKEFQQKVHDDLYKFLLDKKAIDAHLPECPDVEEKWDVISRAYLPDGIREFQEFPVTSLGWMMLIGMAMAYYWDTDWEGNSAREDFYEALRDLKGYDNLDEAVVTDILGYDGEKGEKVTEDVAECASRVYTMLTHNHIEPGSPEAFGCYVAALHELYLMGMAVELNALGYHMTPYNPSGLN
ncbi:MAG: hypothetical protein K2N03_01660 [Muribaculaceae bacterium]|nr:hypothetical protein [Muribaculaceae bacterium]